MQGKVDIESFRAALRARSSPLIGSRVAKPEVMLRQIADWCREHDVAFECYGSGKLVEDFEATVAERLGYPAARFMPSGTLAQSIAVRIWCDRAKLSHFGMHPTSHLEVHEERAYAHLHGLTASLVGPPNRPLLARDFEAVREPIAALLIELPIREAGGQLPSWAELEALKRSSENAEVRLHLDGARLWETAAYYERRYDEICRGFDSCYVSFYKGIGALSGAMLLGPADFIDEAKLWQRRCGGTLYTLGAHIASAAMHFEERLALMPKLFSRAQEIAAVLRDLPHVRLLPDPPHVNMMHAFLPLSAGDAMTRRDDLAERQGAWLFNSARQGDAPHTSLVELYVGDAALDTSDDAIRAAFQHLLSTHG